LACEEFGAKTNHKTQHGKTAIPGFSKTNEAKTGGVVSHGDGRRKVDQIVTDDEGVLRTLNQAPGSQP
jgi:hypothetical protein